MQTIKKIYVVINPNTDDQLALTRGVEIAKRLGSDVHAHLCVFNEEKSENEEIESRKPWLDNYLEPVREMGINIESEITWDKNWQEDLGRAVKRLKPDLIIKALKRHPESSSKLKLLASDWKLFDQAVCPVLLVSPNTKSTGKILAAIDINREDEKYQDIMALVISRAKNIAESRDSELHVVNAYDDTDDYVHVTDVAKKAGVVNEHAHVLGGKPEEVIIEVASKIDAELIVLGISAKHKITTRIFGYTSEWLLNNLSQDVMVVVPNDKMD